MAEAGAAVGNKVTGGWPRPSVEDPVQKGIEGPGEELDDISDDPVRRNTGSPHVRQQQVAPALRIPERIPEEDAGGVLEAGESAPNKLRRSERERVPTRRYSAPE